MFEKHIIAFHHFTGLNCYTFTYSKSVHTTVVTNEDGSVTTVTKTTEHTLVPLNPAMQFDPASLVMIQLDPSLTAVSMVMTKCVMYYCVNYCIHRPPL